MVLRPGPFDYFLASSVLCAAYFVKLYCETRNISTEHIRLNNNELDEFGDIATLIGIEFDENTVWGQLTVMELKLLIHLALKQFEEAQELVEAFLQYNDNTVERKLFYQALSDALEICLNDELDMVDYEKNFRRMFGDPRIDAVLGSIDGSVRFYGLTPTSMQLEGLDRHHRFDRQLQKIT